MSDSELSAEGGAHPDHAGPSRGNDSALDKISDSMNKMFEVLSNMDKAWQNMSRKRGRCSSASSDSDDEPPVQKVQVTDDISDLFDDGTDTASAVMQVPNDDDDIFHGIDDSFSTTNAVGAPVKTKLAEKVNARFRTSLNHDKIKEKQAAYLRPENCGNLVVPRCNDEIWKRLNHFQRRKDMKLANTQRAITASATAIIQMTEALLQCVKNKGDLNMPTLISKATDALALMGHASHELSFRRREQMAVVLKKEYAGLISPSISVTDSLFGDDLSKTMRDLKQTSYISREAGRRNDWSKNGKRFIHKDRKKQWYNRARKHPIDDRK